MSALILAIPSKGRLKEQAEAFLADCGLKLVLEARGYSAAFRNMPDIEVRLMSSSEIAQALRAGVVHAGICGEDLLRESEPAMTRVRLVRALGFGPADLVVAAPKSWVDVRSMADFDAVCHDFRARNGRRLRVATKYQSLARSFFDAHGIDDYRIVHSEGATEGAPAAGAAEAIIDITTTGSTLAANHLKILDDGIILKSQANLAISLAASWNERGFDAFLQMLRTIEARLKAKAWRIVRATRGNGGGDIAALAEAHKARVIADGQFIEMECLTEETGRLAGRLAALGARDIYVMAPTFLFSEEGDRLTEIRDRIAMKP